MAFFSTPDVFGGQIMYKKGNQEKNRKKCFFQKSLAKIQNGAQALDMVRPIFVLWEIIKKFFFISLSFHILVTRNNNFCHPGGSQWVPGGLLACFKAKNCFFFLQICPKVTIFCPKTSQKAPRGPLGPPRMAKIIVPSYQNMQTQ